MTQEFTVLDMTCGGCAASIQQAVSQVPGVTAVDTDVARKHVRVDAAENVSPETIIAVMNNAGYSEVAPRTSTPSPADRWRARALDLAPSKTVSSGCGCCE